MNTFDGIQGSLFDMAIPTPPAPRPVPQAPTAPAAKSPRSKPTKPARRSLIGEVEAALRKLCIPYVSVDQAKKALFADADLKAFHFVVYAKGKGGQDNWLVWCGDPGPDTREDMAQWGQVFGKGFRVVYAMRRAGGIVFRSDIGEPLSLESINQSTSDDESQVREQP